MRALAWMFVALGCSAVACLVDGETIRPDSDAMAGSADASGGKSSSGGKANASAGDGEQAGNADAFGGEASTQGGTTQGGTAQGGKAQGGSGGTAPLGGAGGELQTIDADPPIDVNCGDYRERADANNGDIGYEASKLTLTDELTICGRINSFHFDDASNTVDIDEIGFDVPAGKYIATLELLDADLPERVEFAVGGGDVAASGNHAGIWTEAQTAKTEVFWVTAYNPAAMTHSVLYRVHIRKDDVATRCPSVTAGAATQSYTEAHDNANNAGNDLIAIDPYVTTQMPTQAADQPEPSGIVLSAGDRSLIQGSAADAPYVKPYKDKDTYAISTGTSTQLTLRLDWPSGVDLDLFVFEENNYSTIARAFDVLNSAPELLTLAVEPQSKYWIWVGAGSGGSYPKAYSLTLCGEQFDP